MIVTFIFQLEDINIVHEEIVAKNKLFHFALRATFGTLFAAKFNAVTYLDVAVPFLARMKNAPFR